MKRYKITEELKEAIKNSRYSITRLCKILGFSIKNIIYVNISINENHLRKLTSFFNKNMILVII